MSSKCYLRASITFLDTSLAGASVAEVARSYRPLLKLNDGNSTSCIFARIGDGLGTLTLDTPYEVLIDLRLHRQIEQFYGMPIHEILPIGKDLEIVTTDRVVARGRAEEILEEL
jgi:hypothetical protein